MYVAPQAMVPPWEKPDAHFNNVIGLSLRKNVLEEGLFTAFQGGMTDSEEGKRSMRRIRRQALQEHRSPQPTPRLPNLISLPPEVMDKVGGSLLEYDIAALAATCRRLRCVFEPRQNPSGNRFLSIMYLAGMHYHTYRETEANAFYVAMIQKLGSPCVGEGMAYSTLMRLAEDMIRKGRGDKLEEGRVDACTQAVRRMLAGRMTHLEKILDARKRW